MSTATPFAKIYETEHGQILIKLDEDESDDAQIEVRFYFQPPGCGVCSLALKYENSNHGWEKAEAYFIGIDKNQAIDMILPTLNAIKGDDK